MNMTSLGSVTEVLHFDELLARCLGNIDFAARILAKFQDRFGEELAQLEMSLSQGDADKVAQVAHRIKGASANVSAPYLYEIAAEIEQLGRAERLTDIPPGVAQLRDEWTRFVNGVSTLEFTQCDAS